MSWFRRRDASKHSELDSGVDSSFSNTPVETQPLNELSKNIDETTHSLQRDSLDVKDVKTSSPPLSPLIEPLQTTKTYPHWHDIVAGAAAGVGARAITAPLDLLKIRRQLQSSSTSSNYASSTVPHIKGSAVATNATAPINLSGEWKIFEHLYSIYQREGGIRSLFRGNVAASYLWMGYSVVQFWVYGYSSEYLRQRYALLNKTGTCNKNSNHPELGTKLKVSSPENSNNSNNDVKISGIISFSSGAIAGVCGTLLTYPFDLCRTIFAARGIFPIAASNVTWSHHTTNLASQSKEQIQRRPPKTLNEFARQLYIQKGFRGFFAGSAPAMLQIVPYMGLNFALHDFFVHWSENYSSGNAVASGVGGMGAGVISKFLVYPLDTVKKRLQAQAFWGSNSSDKGSNTNFSAFPKKKVVKAGNVRVGVTHHGVTTMAYDGMFDCIQQIAKREGTAAFYKGLIPSLLKSSFSTGASFWLFTMTKDILQSIHDSTHL